MTMPTPTPVAAMGHFDLVMLLVRFAMSVVLVWKRGKHDREAQRPIAPRRIGF
jgi:hypothetical protein